MRTRILVIGLVGIGLLGTLVKRHCDRCKAAAPVETVETTEVDKSIVPARMMVANNLEAGLLESVTLKLEDQTLRRIVAELQNASGANIVIDEAALQEAGISPDERLSLMVENISCRSALNILLHQLKLVFVIRDEVGVVTTAKSADGKLVQATYSVADLVVPIQYDNVPADFWGCGPAREKVNRAPTLAVAGVPLETLADKLITTICNMVRPDSWSSAGGQGRIQYFPLGMALVVNQTAGAQEEIKELLTKLRRLQEVEVVLDMRVFRCPASLLKRCGLDGDNVEDASGLLEVVDLEETTAKELVDTLQGDRQSDMIHQAPRLTVFNGQRAALKSVEEENHVVGYKVSNENGNPSVQLEKQLFRSGYRFAVCPTVSEDCKSVRVHLQACLDRVDLVDEPHALFRTESPVAGQGGAWSFQVLSPARPRTATLKVDRTLQLADGRSALLHCGSMKEHRNACPEWLREVPGVGRLLRQLGTSSEETQVAILVTPRIVVPAAEQIFLGQLPPVPRAGAEVNQHETEDLRQIRGEWDR